MTNWVERLTGETQAKLLGLLRRSRHTINSLAKALDLTDNAVRLHIDALRRDAIVADVGVQRDTGGKPARVYGLTAEGEELFPKAYGFALAALVDEIVRRDGPERARELLRAVGARAGAASGEAGPLDRRVRTAAAALRQLGADVDVQRTTDGWRLQGYACPLSGVTADRPEACGLVQALIEEITGRPVTECCQRGARPRCAFELAG